MNHLTDVLVVSLLCTLDLVAHCLKILTPTSQQLLDITHGLCLGLLMNEDQLAADLLWEADIVLETSDDRVQLALQSLDAWKPAHVYVVGDWRQCGEFIVYQGKALTVGVQQRLALVDSPDQLGEPLLALAQLDLDATKLLPHIPRAGGNRLHRLVRIRQRYL